MFSIARRHGFWMAFCFFLSWSYVQAVQPGDSFRDCEQCPEMVVVPAGTFQLRNAPWGPGHPHNEGFF